MLQVRSCIRGSRSTGPKDVLPSCSDSYMCGIFNMTVDVTVTKQLYSAKTFANLRHKLTSTIFLLSFSNKPSESTTRSDC